MRGDRFARQWRIIRAVEASPDELTVPEIAQSEEIWFHTISRDRAVRQVAGFAPYTGRANRSNCSVYLYSSNFKIPPSFPLTGFVPIYFCRDLVSKSLDQSLPELPGGPTVDLMRISRAILPRGDNTPE
jgi:hypothetical protein